MDKEIQSNVFSGVILILNLTLIMKITAIRNPSTFLLALPSMILLLLKTFPSNAQALYIRVWRLLTINRTVTKT